MKIRTVFAVDSAVAGWAGTFGRCLPFLQRIRSAHLEILVFPVGGAF